MSGQCGFLLVQYLHHIARGSSNLLYNISRISFTMLALSPPQTPLFNSLSSGAKRRAKIPPRCHPFCFIFSRYRYFSFERRDIILGLYNKNKWFQDISTKLPISLRVSLSVFYPRGDKKTQRQLANFQFHLHDIVTVRFKMLFCDTHYVRIQLACTHTLQFNWGWDPTWAFERQHV